ncbi:MAG: HAF repeat-containing protein [Pseudomonadota bacterium]
MHFALPRSFALLTLFAACAPAFAAVNPTAAVTSSLGIVGPAGESTIAFDINPAGQVAAVLQDEQGRQRGVLFEKGLLTELGAGAGMYSDAKAINVHGEIVGSASHKDGSWRAFLFDRARGMRELPTLGGRSSYGMSINRDGHAAGFADTASGDWHAFVYKGGDQMLDLGTLGGKISYASGMNNGGQVVGTATTHDDYRHAFVYDPASGMRDLGTLGGRQSSATAINDAGVVVGASETKDRRWHAFIHDGKRMIDLGALIGRGSSFATDINNHGHVVGTILLPEERMSFVWRDGKMTIHRGGKGLHLTNSITDAELLVGATYDLRMNAATMPSNAIPAIQKSGNKLFLFMGAVLLLAFGAAAYRQFGRTKEAPLVSG